MPPIKFLPISPESSGALRYSLNIFKYSTMRLISETGLPFNAEAQRLQHTYKSLCERLHNDELRL